ncbi:MAG: DUF1801 domain-containing protein [Gammaproteobacteria bacterium]|nr:DUF1801 domain-containing protein [Gammaproteobacteria bacterium]
MAAFRKSVVERRSILFTNRLTIDFIVDLIEAARVFVLGWSIFSCDARKILPNTGLEETTKWGGPCYTFDGKNVVGLGSFKSYFGLWFFHGVLLKDDRRVLINVGWERQRYNCPTFAV